MGSRDCMGLRSHLFRSSDVAERVFTEARCDPIPHGDRTITVAEKEMQRYATFVISSVLDIAN